MPQSDQCILCAHYQMGGTCDAFPDGIPGEIFDGRVDHAQPYAGDHGIQFKPLNVEDNAQSRWSPKL